MTTAEGLYEIVNKAFALIGMKYIHCERKITDRRDNLFQRIMFVFGYLNLWALLFSQAIMINVTFQALMSDISDKSGNFKETFNRLSEMIPCIIFTFMCLVKVTSYLVQKKRINELFIRFEKVWPSVNNKKENEIVSEAVSFSANLTVIYTIVTNFVSFIYNLFPFFIMGYNYWSTGSTPRLLPYFMWFPWDWENSWPWYLFTFFIECHAGLFTTATVSGIDCFLCLMLAQLKAQFHLLAIYIQDISHNDSDIIENEEKAENKIKRAIEYHTTLIELVGEVESVYGFKLFMNLLTSSFAMCLLIFSITFSTPDRVIKYLTFLSSNLTQITLISLHGDNLREESESVMKAAYNSDWVGGSVKHLRSLQILQNRAIKPLKISVLGFTTISLTTLTTIVNSAWSYFTLIRTLFNNSDLFD